MKAQYRVPDLDLHGIQGMINVQPYAGDNRLFRHGPIRVATNRRHFKHADGTPFLWLGDTWWMGLCSRLSFPDDFGRLVADRRDKGFNVIQIVAGLYPDMPAFDPRGANEAGFPWAPGYERINPRYFDETDRRINALVEAGFVPCIVGAWGYHLPWLGLDRMKQHWRNLVARYNAYPVVWCVAGEQVTVVSDTEWRCSQSETAGWRDVHFADRVWPKALRVAPYGGGPWGELRSHIEEFVVPYAAGIPAQVRVIYLPTSASASVRHLEPELSYNATYFDPVTGTRHRIGTARGDTNGNWTVPAPPDPEHDWVLLLRVNRP